MYNRAYHDMYFMIHISQLRTSKKKQPDQVNLTTSVSESQFI